MYSLSTANWAGLAGKRLRAFAAAIRRDGSRSVRSAFARADVAPFQSRALGPTRPRLSIIAGTISRFAGPGDARAGVASPKKDCSLSPSTGAAGPAPSLNSAMLATARFTSSMSPF